MEKPANTYSPIVVKNRLNSWINYYKKNNTNCSHAEAIFQIKNSLQQKESEVCKGINKTLELTLLTKQWFESEKNARKLEYKGINLGCCINMRVANVFSNYLSNKKD
ncbi:hypothetical protein [Marinospirillum perlucidum]|uniref:hypothetical protein n=1 Tax=Marinospirillum perlucidum TaxID=1982602 RepID=UPI000DF465F4|nr:hypothetical protein [Marinospirillum perlucidum]